MMFAMNTNDTFQIDTILFDLNGSLAHYGKIPGKVRRKLRKLTQWGYQVVIISSDQRGNASSTARKMGIEFIQASTRNEKQRVAERYNKKTTAAVGNGRVDIGLFDQAILSVAIIGKEGCHSEVIQQADVVFSKTLEALEFFWITLKTCGLIKIRHIFLLPYIEKNKYHLRLLMLL